MVRGRAVHSPKFRERKKKVMRVFWVAIVCIVISFSYLLIRLLAANSLQIDTVTVSGAADINPANVEALALDKMQGNYLGVIPRSNFIFYPEGTIIAAVRQQFPAIDEIMINHPSIHELHIALREYSTTALWCEGEFAYHTFGETPCYYLNQNGYAYGNASSTDDRNFVRYYGTATSTPHLGMSLMDSERFHQIDEFVSGINRIPLPVVGLSVGNQGSYELYILTSQATTSDYATIYFNDRTPFSTTLDNLVQFIHGGRKLLNTGTSTLDYIDARYGSTIFLKMKHD